MTLLTEGNLQFDFSKARHVRKFDDQKIHGLSHCMKAVDFIVELENRVLFVEVKDPQHPLSRSKDSNRFIEHFLSGQIEEDFKYKYRDSFLYEWAANNLSKPVYYLILIALDTLEDADLLTRILHQKKWRNPESPLPFNQLRANGGRVSP